MHKSCWDIFTSRRSPSSLWFGYQLARNLSQRGQRTRLFTDELPELAASVPDLQPARWAQMHLGFEVIDASTADITPIAPVALQMLDTPIPPAYRRRLAAYPGPTRCLQVVTHADLVDDGSPLGPLVPAGQDGHCSQWLAQFGDAPLKAGYIKHLRQWPTGPIPWGRAKARVGMLQALGLRADLLEGQLSVFFDVRLPYPIAPLLDRLAAGPRPVCLLMDPRSLEWAASQTSLPWVRDRQGLSDVLVHGAVTLVALPSRRWALTDGLIASVDLVMSTESDIALRASASGTPIVYSCNDTGFFNWYALDSGPVMRRTLAGVFNAVATAQDVKAAWTLYMARWDEMQALAGRVAQRIRRAPDLADVLLASLGEDSTESVVRQFAPTEPGMALA
jgi:hypothetical protein